MQRRIAAAILVLLGTPPEVASGQFGLHSKRETYTVPVSHPPEIVLPNVKRIAITGVTTQFLCGQIVRDRLAETITRSGTFELISAPVNGNLQAAAFADRTNALRLAKTLGPAAIIAYTVSRCDAEVSPMTTQYGKRDKKGHTPVYSSRTTTAHFAMSVQIIDVATSKVVLARNFGSDPVEERNAVDAAPEVVDSRELLGQATIAAEQDVEHLLFGWRESINVTVHADKECNLKPAADQIRGGDFAGAAETMQKAIDRQCDAPDDKIALAKAYHNMGVALTYAGRPEEGLKSLQQANALWPGNISEEAMTATRKVIAARGEQQIQDAAAADAAKTASANSLAAEAPDPSRLSNKDVTEMVQAKLSDQIIISKMRTTRCRFDTSPNALIQLKKSGASDAVMLAVTNAQCTN
jgi:hypothetical protein